MNPVVTPLAIAATPPRSISTLSELDWSLLTDLYQLTMTACYAGEFLERSVASFAAPCVEFCDAHPPFHPDSPAVPRSEQRGGG